MSPPRSDPSGVSKSPTRSGGFTSAEAEAPSPDKKAAPVCPGVSPPGGSRLNQPVDQNRLENIMLHPTDTTSEVPLPLGAEPPHEWESGLTPADPKWRCVWSPPFEESIDIRCVVTQYLDGTIAKSGDDAPLVYIGCHDFLVDDARAIAASIIRAADLADKWVTR